MSDPIIRNEIDYLDVGEEGNSQRYYFSDVAARELLSSLEDEVENQIGVYGAKNMLPYPYKDTTKTENGLTITDVGNGILTIDGTATAATSFSFVNGDGTEKVPIPQHLKGLTIILSVNEVNANAEIRIDTFNSLGNGLTHKIVTGVREDSYTIPSNAVYWSISYNIASGGTFSSFTLKPMIRLITVDDSTWVPYAKTNQELTLEGTVAKVDGTSIIKNNDGSISVNSYYFDTIEEMNQAIAQGLIREGAMIYVAEDGAGGSQASPGSYYATCVTAEATVAKVATTTENFSLMNGCIVAVFFENGAPENATLNVDGTGAKPIYYRNALLTDGVINEGDTITFMYSNNRYHIISMDTVSAAVQLTSYSYDGETRGITETGGGTSYSYDSATRGITETGGSTSYSYNSEDRGLTENN